MIFSEWSNKKDNDMVKFAKQRYNGAKKIIANSIKKGGTANLTKEHFKVKLPYYNEMIKGNAKAKDMKNEYKRFCNELHSHINKIEKMDMKKFQELVGKIEVLGELLIQDYEDNNDKKSK